MGQGDLWFARVAVLGDEVTGKAGEVEVYDLARAPFAQRDHFAGAGKMMLHFVARLGTRLVGTGDGLLEPTPLRVAQQRQQIVGCDSASLGHVSASMTQSA